MRTVLFIIQKEFSQFFREKTNIRMLLVMPVIQLILLPLAANYEVRNIQICIVDHDHSGYVRELTHKIAASPYFKLNSYLDSYKDGLERMEHDEVDIVLEIPPDFEKT